MLMNRNKTPVSLEVFLEKMARLNKLLGSCGKKEILMGMDTKENIRWYCSYRIKQYYKKYLAYLQKNS